MVKSKSVKNYRKRIPVKKSNYSKKNKKSKSVTRKKTRKSQRGGNRVMIDKLCSSSNNGATIEQKDRVSGAYLKELCNENDRNNDTSQSGGSGLVSKIFKAATFPISIASGTFQKISGINLKEIVSNNINKVLNQGSSSSSSSSNESVSTSNSVKKSGDREKDVELGNFLSKRNL